MAGARPSAVIFDVGRVLYDWDPRFLYERLIPEGEALDAFLRDVVTPDWHFQHDAGRDFADTSAELTALHPHDAGRTVFVDDNAANVEGASGVGLIALHFTGEPKVRRELEMLGLLA